MHALIRHLAVPGVALIAAAAYGIRIWWFPYGRCRRCNGAGMISDASGKHARLCHRCKGVRPLRLGRRIYNYLHASRRAAR